jgi:hypothetical protein
MKAERVEWANAPNFAPTPSFAVMPSRSCGGWTGMGALCPRPHRATKDLGTIRNIGALLAKCGYC